MLVIVLLTSHMLFVQVIILKHIKSTYINHFDFSSYIVSTIFHIRNCLVLQ